VGSETHQRAQRETSEIAGGSARLVWTDRRTEKGIADEGKKTEAKLKMTTAVLVVSMAVTFAASGLREMKQEKSQHCQRMHQDEMAMGFSQTKASHHFQLTKSGGVIEVEVKDPSDTSTQEQVRRHLQGIAKEFADGNFSSPMLTHGEIPPGVPDMQRLKTFLSYKYAETDRGGKVVIHATNAETLKAVHEFLRFQIHEHHTGDPELIGN
jgi:hypothetical protein